LQEAQHKTKSDQINKTEKRKTTEVVIEKYIRLT
jgi:hypothetical protein